MGRIDVNAALSQAWAVFLANMGPLIVGTMLMIVFSLLSLMLLGGVMSAGLFVMIRNGFEGRPVEVTDIFAGFQHFCRYFWGGVLGFFVALAGFGLCCVGVFFTAALVVFLYPLLINGCGPGQAIGLSWDRFWKDFGGFMAVSLITYGLNFIAGTVPFAVLFATPLGCCIVYAAYRQVYGDGDPRLAAAQPIEPAAGQPPLAIPSP